MTREVEIDGRELLELSEEAPQQVETIIERMFDADEDLVFDEADEA